MSEVMTKLHNRFQMDIIKEEKKVNLRWLVKLGAPFSVFLRFKKGKNWPEVVN